MFIWLWLIGDKELYKDKKSMGSMLEANPHIIIQFFSTKVWWQFYMWASSRLFWDGCPILVLWQYVSAMYISCCMCDAFIFWVLQLPSIKTMFMLNL